MKRQKTVVLLSLVVVLVATIFLAHCGLIDGIASFLIPAVFAHCDTMDGPVVQAARKALEEKNINLVLIWVQKDDEAEIKEAFQKTLAVRGLNPDTKALADMYFFETLVRIHRAGEGAPYTGLKPAGTEVEPGIAEADKAVESESADELLKKMSSHMTAGIEDRFNRVLETKKHMNDSVEAGREYVEAYVTFIHHIEAIHLAISGQSSDHSKSEGAKGNSPHQH
jgi:hypothetical protein